MGAQRRVRRTDRGRTVRCGAEHRLPPAELAPARADAEARVIALRGGVRWLVTVVARLLSEDVAAGTESARLVLRFECLTQPHRPVRVATVRARSLHALDADTLRALAAVPAARTRQAGIRRHGGERGG